MVGHTWPMAVIPEDRLMQKAVPSMIILAEGLPFFSSSTWKISSRKGMKATNSTEGEMNSPMKVTAKNRKLTKDQGPLRAMALVMKVTVQRRTKWVLDSGYTSMKVKSRKATVVFPKVPFRVFPKPKWGRKPKRKMVIRLGQSMEW